MGWDPFILYWASIIGLINQQLALISFHPYDIAHTGFAVISVISLSTLSFFPMSFTVESFLRNRSSQDHEATAMMKAQFMSLWDGLDTSATTQVKTTTLHHLCYSSKSGRDYRDSFKKPVNLVRYYYEVWCKAIKGFCLWTCFLEKGGLTLVLLFTTTDKWILSVVMHLVDH